MKISRNNFEKLFFKEYIRMYSIMNQICLIIIKKIINLKKIAINMMVASIINNKMVIRRWP